MITLKTLPQATPQEIFDQAARHLLKQNEISGIINECYYRYGNLKCAAGIFIDDNEYDESMEASSWEHLVDRGIAPSEHQTLIGELQCIHDNTDPKSWSERLTNLAKEWKLKTDVVIEFSVERLV